MGGELNMIKKQQKWIAFFAALAFLWLAQVSAMPLAAAGATEQLSAASAEQGPNFVEQEGSSGYHAKKKSILPVILIGVGVAAVAAVLILVVFKTKYDITGNWQYYYKWDDKSTTDGPFGLVFTGEKNSGQLIFHDDMSADMNGTYTANEKNVTFIINSNHAWNHSGSFESKDKMSGRFTYPSRIGTGTWYATRSQ